MEHIKYNESDTVLERIFPWTRTGRITEEPIKISHNVIKDQAPKNDIIPTKPQNPSETTDKLRALREKIAASTNPQNTSTDDQNSASIFEMWNLIESVGIKRDMLSKVITSEEAVTELYHVIEKRIHYDREQEMIRRLRQHVTKLNVSNIAKKEVIKEMTV